MFKKPFSSEGRIRRSEFGISCIISGVLNVISDVFVMNDSTIIIALVIYFPNLWFMLAQGAKRCHDLGHNGWWQIIPFYSLWMLFQDGEPGTNEYGNSPKYNSMDSAPAREYYVQERRSAQVYGMQTQRMDVRTIMTPESLSAIGNLKDDYGRTYPLAIGINTIGRGDPSSSASVQILTEDRYMSRNHAVIDVTNTGREISHILKFGENRQISIYLNGAPLNVGSNAILSNGDRIKLGHTELTFMA
jgi:uncharacterized membrane protein YhaH (DUF805 family)